MVIGYLKIFSFLQIARVGHDTPGLSMPKKKTSAIEKCKGAPQRTSFESAANLLGCLVSLPFYGNRLATYG